MKRRSLAIAALATTLATTVAVAAPLIFEETAKINSPDPAYTVFPLKVAVEGDTIIATGLKTQLAAEPYEHYRSYYAAFLFRRQSNGSWTYERTLAQDSCDEGEQGEDTCPVSVAIRNGVAAVSAGQVHVFRRAPNGNWIADPTNAFSGPGDVAVGNGVVLTSHPVCEGLGVQAFKPNPSGVWTEAFAINSELGCDLWGRTGGDVDISAGNRWITSDTLPPATYIFEPTPTSWTQVATLTSPLNSALFGFSLAIDDTRAFVSGAAPVAPIHVFNRAGNTWTHSADIAVPDGANRSRATDIQVRDRLFVGFANDGHRRGSVSVFRANSSGQYDEVAKLVASSLENQSLGSKVDAWIDGSFSRVVATGPTAVHVFDLNQLGTTPAPTQEDFEQGNAANWVPIAGSSFSVVTDSGSQVYRQSNTTGDAGAYVTNINWTNQAIEADVRPTAFDGADRWVGLVVRRTDANNYYYLTLRQSNVLELKRRVNGAFLTLATTPVPVALNRNYRLRLEAVGTRLRAYVDGRKAVEASDTALRQGHAGVQMYRTRADFDNVVLSQNPHLTLLEHRTPYFIDGNWNYTLGSWSSTYTTGQARLVQQDTAGDARAMALAAANDQIVQVAATATSFAAGAGSRWFGVVARYVDANNFYYVTVRQDNTISLRKLVNGTIQVLDTAPFTVTAGTTYTLRLQAIGTSLRAYVNGNLVLEGNDSSHASGQYGLATYKTAATFDDLVAWEP
jgi:hypothetical protein